MKQFAGQHDGEEVLFVFRRHIIALRKGFYGLVIPFAIFSLPALIVPLLPFSLPMWLMDPYMLLGVAGVGFAIGMVLFLYHWMGWYYSYFIVTNERLRQVNQAGIFGKSVIDLSLTKIQNISYNVEGAVATIFNFGIIVVQTYVGDLVLDKIHRPDEIYNKLQDAAHAAKPIDNEPNEEPQEQAEQTQKI